MKIDIKQIEKLSNNKVVSCYDIEALKSGIDFTAIHDVKSFGEPSYSVEDGTARIKVRGMLIPDTEYDLALWGLTGYNIIRNYAENAEDDSSIDEIILDIDSGGGIVKGLVKTIEFLESITKPIKVEITGDAYSAAYWLATVGSEISASSDSGVGSIGARIEHTDVSEMLTNEGVKKNSFVSGFWKDAFSPYRPLSEKARDRLQDEVNSTAKAFFEQVAKSRNIPVSDIEALDADIFSASEALTKGLITRIAESGQSTKQEGDDDMTAIADAKAEGRREALAEVEENSKKVMARTKEIYALDVSDEIKTVLASAEFANVPVSALSDLVATVPKGFTQVMDEDGGAGVEASPIVKPIALSDAEIKAQAQTDALAVLVSKKGKIL